MKDYAPQFTRKTKNENKIVSLILFVLFSFNGMMALAILALAKTGPISPATEAMGWTCAVASVFAAWAGWNRKI